MNKTILTTLILILLTIESSASIKDNLIENLLNIQNVSFNFEQNINNNIENGNCTIKYPKKIYCKYDLPNKKVLVSNGRSVVIKTITSYYIYPIEKTPLNLILDKKLLLNKIKNLDERIIDEKYINFNFSQNDIKINIFFDKETFNLIGWQTLDIYQNLSITYLNSIIKNKKLEKDFFSLPKQN